MSALNFGGTPNELLKLLERDAFELFMSESLVEEVRRVLQQERFGWTEEDLTEGLNPIISLATIVSPGIRVDTSVDPPDNRILECALESKSDVIVTGDDHLLRLGTFENIPIVTPRDFLEMLRGNEGPPPI